MIKENKQEFQKEKKNFYYENKYRKNNKRGLANHDLHYFLNSI